MLHLVPQQDQTSQDVGTDKTARRAKSAVKVDYSITYALPEQVGFCVPLIAEDSLYTQRLRSLLDKEGWVISQQVNWAAGSIVIHYKPELMSDYETRCHLASLIQSAGDAGVINEPVTTAKALPSSCPETVTLPQKMQRETPQLKVVYSIAHAIPGRVRFRVPLIAQNPKYIHRLEALLKADPVVTSERVNSAAASIVITYNQQPSQTFSDRVSHLSRLIQAAAWDAA